MANYRSLVPGGFFSSPEDPAHYPVSIRSNNPGAVNGASWLRAMPGYVTEIKFDGKNNTTIFETPEQGVAVYFELLKRYAANGKTSIGQIIKQYGGGQDYSGYITTVSKWTGLPASTEIDLDDDATLLPFAKAMFRYEAGRVPPWSDAQILYGFNLGRGKKPQEPQAPVTKPAKSWWELILSFPFGWLLPKRETAPEEPESESETEADGPVTNEDILNLAASYIGKFEDGPDVVMMANYVGERFPELRDYVKQASSTMPWCGALVAYVLAHFGIRPPLPDADGVGYFYVDSWKRFGKVIPVGQEQPGDICLFLYPGVLHHITFVAGDGFYIGGNQNDAVTKTRFGRKPSAIRRAV